MKKEGKINFPFWSLLAVLGLGYLLGDHFGNKYNPRKAKNGISYIHTRDSSYKVRVYIDSAYEREAVEEYVDKRP